MSKIVGTASPQLRRSEVIAYASPMMACYFLLGPTYNIVPTIYAKYHGLDLTVIALVVLCTRILDAISDPLIGLASDRHRSNGGSRKIWVAAGGAAMIVASIGLFSPPQSPSTFYYFLFMLIFFLSYSLMDIPHGTWGGELTRDYVDRSRVYSYRGAAIFIGFILWSGFPLLPMFETSEFTPDVLRNIAFAGMAMIIFTVIIAAFGAPRGAVNQTLQKVSLREAAASVSENKPLQILLAAYLLCALALGMWQGLIFLYLTSYLDLGPHFAAFQFGSNIVALAAIPLWQVIARRLQKSTLWILGMIIFAFSTSLFIFVNPQTPWVYPLLIMAAAHVTIACLYIIFPALLSDVVDYAALKFRQNRGATYFALGNLIGKAGLGAGGALGLAIAGASGVIASQVAQTDAAIAGLKVSFILAPVMLAIISALLIWRLPLTRHRQEIIRRRLESRLRGSQMSEGRLS